MDIKNFINSEYRYAVVGATNNADKYGYKVLKDLHDAEFSTVGVNPHYSEIEGIPVYPSLGNIPEKPDVAVVVIPPDAGIKILEDAKQAGILKLWFQPGAESNEIDKKAKELGLEIVADGSCIMVARRSL